MSAAIVFAGPSLPIAVRPAGFAWRPPAQAGDLLALLPDPPDTICLIDGYFDSRPAPWHKEILLLLQAGARVLGAASIGALRAAELDGFGMEGIGAIYRAFRDGRLTGDDEVALVHAPEELGYRRVTEPMIEVRATLAAAVRTARLPAARARAIRAAAHSIHFSRRDWTSILAAADAGDLDWLPAAPVRLKQRDALLCLAAATAPRPAMIAPAVPLTRFIASLAGECGVPIPIPAQPGDRAAAP